MVLVSARHRAKVAVGSERIGDYVAEGEDLRLFLGFSSAEMGEGVSSIRICRQLIEVSVHQETKGKC